MKKNYHAPNADSVLFDQSDILTGAAARRSIEARKGMTRVKGNMRKLTAALLALLICVCAFASCAGDQKPGDNTGTSDPSVSTTAAATEEENTTEEETTTEEVTTEAPLPGDRFDSDAFPPKA